MQSTQPGFIRKGLFIGALAGLMIVLLARMIDVQVVHGQRFVTLADNNRFFSLAVPANRGVFIDRYGDSLVWNTRTYEKKIEPHSLYSETVPIDNEEALQLIATSGGYVERKVSRQYRFGKALAHVLGYVGPVTAEDVESDETLLPNDLIGKIGLEAMFNQQLRGKAGSEVWEINARVARQRKVSEVEPVAGEAIATSLDPYVSEVAASALGEKRGSVVVADAATGKILALVNSPSYDPNVFTSATLDSAAKAQKQQQITSLFADSNNPFFDRAVAGSYPPGSVFKLVTALAGLESKAITADTTVIDEGVLKVGEYQYGNWYYRQYGRTEGEIGLVRSIARSNDIFFYKAAEYIGVNQLAAMSTLFGLGRQTGVELTPEAAGLVPTPSWKEQIIGEPWYLGNTYHMGIGQGDLLVSPIQIAQLVQTIANQGLQCRPSVLAKSNPDCRSLSLQEQNISLVIQGMLDACSPGGTAFPFFERNGLARAAAVGVTEALHAGAVACKTGTAEFGGADERGYRKTHGWWVGIVEPQVNFIQTQDQSAIDGQTTDEGSQEQPSDATSSASIDVSLDSTATQSGVVPLQELRNQWLQAATSQTFPQRLVIVVLVESDETQPFQEGSRDAGPVGKAIIDWLEG